MARPTSRTETVEAEPMRRLFGSAANAFKNLAISGEVSYPVFVRAYRGDLVDKPTKQAVEGGWARFLRAMASSGSSVLSGGRGL